MKKYVVMQVSKTRIDGKEIGYVSVLTESKVEKEEYVDCIKKILYKYLI